MSAWSQGQVISLVALIGWLILVVSGFASYRLGARQVIRLALVWAAIFVGAFALVSWLP